MAKKSLTPEEEHYKRYLSIAQSAPLEDKIQTALMFLKFHETLALQNHEEGFYLAFSGGKDSIVLKELARMAAVKHICYYNVTTIDPPELVRYIQKEHPEIVWNRPEKNLIMKMSGVEGPPTRLNRWCCKVYKEHGGDGRIKLIGVRASESPRRAAQWREVIPNRNGGTVICPILYWTDGDIWDFIRLKNLPYCSLYDEGFNRLGCIGCPMSGKKGVKRDFERWPGFERLWRLGFKMYWERWRGVPRRDGKPRAIDKFPSLNAFWNWWISREKWKGDEVCQGLAQLESSSSGNE